MEGKEIKRRLLILLDGLSNFIPKDNRFPTSWKIGLCHIEFIDSKLHLHCRRLGILIGKGGQIINALEEELGCKIHLHEVDFELGKTSLVSETELNILTNKYDEIINNYKKHIGEIDRFLDKLNNNDYVQKN